MKKITLAVPGTDTTGAAKNWRGGWGTVSYRVTSGTGTATLQVSFNDGTTYETAVDSLGDNVAFTATGHKQLAYPADTLMRWSVSGSSSLVAASDVIYGVAGVRRGNIGN